MHFIKEIMTFIGGLILFTLFISFIEESFRKNISMDDKINNVLLNGLVFFPLVIIGAFSFLLSSLTLFEQIYYYLKYSIYIDLSLYACLTPNTWTGKGPLKYIPEYYSHSDFSQWLMNPSDWLGLHSILIPILKSVPIWLAGYAVVLVVFIIIGTFSNRVS